MSYPEPANVAPWYLRNITQALALDETTGNVYIRTGITGDIIIEGNVNIPGNINARVYELGNIDISSNTMPISGNVSITALPEVEIKNDAGNPIPVSRTTAVNSIDNPFYVEGVNNASFFAPTQSDAFGRLGVSNPYTLFDTQNQYVDNGQFVSNLVAGGNCVYNANSSSFMMTVAGSGDAVYRETTKTFVYQPGKSLQILNTFCGNTPTAGLIQRVGYFDPKNGIYFEVNGTTKNMVIRSSSTGSLTYETVPQGQWNGDRLDGLGGNTNPSGIKIEVDRDQIFWMDIEWLGVGSVRTGFVIDGQFIVCHTFNHANQPGNVTTYMGTAVLPVRYELISTGPSANLRQICSSVVSEGGYQLSGVPNGRGHDLGAPIRLPNDSSFKPLMSIRLKSTTPNAVVIPVDFTIVPEDQALVKYRVYPKAVTTGGSWISAGSTSNVEYNLAPGNIISGDHSYSSFLISNNQSINTPQSAQFDFTEQLQRDPFTPTMYEYVLAAATTGTNIDVYASINWQEIT